MAIPNVEYSSKACLDKSYALDDRRVPVLRLLKNTVEYPYVGMIQLLPKLSLHASDTISL